MPLICGFRTPVVLLLFCLGLVSATSLLRRQEASDVKRERCKSAYARAPSTFRNFQKTLTFECNDEVHCNCPAVDRIKVGQIAGRPKLKVDSVVIGFIPKVASTTIREVLIPVFAPGYKQLYFEAGHPNKGEENGWYRCKEMAGPEGEKQYKFILVRDPLSRFLSGLYEVVSRHKSVWNKWRRSAGKPNVCADCSINSYVLPYLSDISDGWGNVHTHLQTGFLVGSNASWPNYIGKVEQSDRAWAHVRKELRLGESTPPVEFPYKHTTSDEVTPTLSMPETVTEDEQIVGERNYDHLLNEDDDMDAASLILSNGSMFSRRAWKYFCDLYRQDYECLGYPLPTKCSEHMSFGDMVLPA